MAVSAACWIAHMVHNEYAKHMRSAHNHGCIYWLTQYRSARLLAHDSNDDALLYYPTYINADNSMSTLTHVRDESFVILRETLILHEIGHTARRIQGHDWFQVHGVRQRDPLVRDPLV